MTVREDLSTELCIENNKSLQILGQIVSIHRKLYRLEVAYYRSQLYFLKDTALRTAHVALL